MMGSNSNHAMDDHLEQIRTPQEIASDGGHAGAKITKQPRSGEQAQHDWDKTHGKLSVPSYLRQPKKKLTGREPFSPQ